MSNTATVITTKAGEALIAQMQAENKVLVIDKFIFANVPNRPAFPSRDDVVPVEHVVHESAVHEQGRLTENSVIYSTTLASNVGPFSFNWSGLFCSEHNVLVAINFPPPVDKTVDAPGITGNTLVRSFVLEYKGISETTNITVDPSSWQYDAHKRMSKMDNDTAQAIIDQNGKDWFIDDGFIVTPQSSAYSIKAGAGYVSGHRISLDFDRIIQVPEKPAFIYVDAFREGSPTGEWQTKFTFVVAADEKDDYTDVQGVNHFVCKIAQVFEDGSVGDLRKKDKVSHYIDELLINEATRFGGIYIGVYKPNVKDFVPANSKTKKLCWLEPKNQKLLMVADDLVHSTAASYDLDTWWIEVSERMQSIAESACKDVVIPAPSYTALDRSRVDGMIIDHKLFDVDIRNSQLPFNARSADFDGSVIKLDEGYGVPLNNSLYLMRKNREYLFECARMLEHHEPLQIQYFGDSNSANNDSLVVTTFQSCMQQMYPNLPDVIMRAVPGMNTHRMFSWQCDDNDSQLSIINLGTNDALWDKHWKKGGVLTDYAENLRACISREILRGKAVVVVSLIPQRIDGCNIHYNNHPITFPDGSLTNNIRPDAMVLRSLAEQIAIECGCFFVDMLEALEPYSDTIFVNTSDNTLENDVPYGDQVHVKTDVQRFIGRYLASAVCANGLIRKEIAFAGKDIQVRPGIDPITTSMSISASETYMDRMRYDSQSMQACNALSEIKRDGSYTFRSLHLKKGRSITFSFYTETSDVVITPVLYTFAGCTVTMFHNFGGAMMYRRGVDIERTGTEGFGWDGVGTPNTSIGSEADNCVNIPATKTITGVPKVFNRSYFCGAKGWHSITLSVDCDNGAFVSGLIIEGKSDYKHRMMSLSGLSITNIVKAGDYVYKTGNNTDGPLDGATWHSLTVTRSDTADIVVQKVTGDNGRISTQFIIDGIASGWVIN